MTHSRTSLAGKPLRIVFVSRVRLNPYVRLLARGVKAALPDAHIEHAHFLSLPWLLRNLHHVDILHIHWIEHLYLAPKAWQRRKGFISVFLAIILARLAGKHIIYTVHNLNQHEGRSPILNRMANHLIFRLAHAVHVHDASVAQVVRRRYHRRHHVYIIPHGNYIGAYPDTTNREEARSYLIEEKKIPVGRDTYLFLSLGQVRPYKGLEALIQAFRQVDDPRARLLIAGKAEEPAYAQHIRELAQEDDRIITHLTYVPDEELQYFFRAADVCVFPYRRITTSGAALLAFSFGCPIIAPILGPFPELAADGRGLLYPPGDIKGLAAALRRALQGELRESKHHALAYARSLNWPELGRQHVRVYERMLCRPLLPPEQQVSTPLPPIICAGKEPWAGPWRNRHQLMSRLAKETPILYLEPRPYLRGLLRRATPLSWLPRTRHPLPHVPDLHVLSLPAWTARSNRFPGRIGDAATRLTVQKALDRATRCVPSRLHAQDPVQPPILWLTSPDQDDLLRLVPHRLVVYHVVDDYTAYEADYADPSRLHYVRTQHKHLLQQADVIICTHPALVAQAQQWNTHVYLVRNGVDWPLYRRLQSYPLLLPQDLASIPRPRIGYVGVLNDKIDIPLLRQLVDALPNVHLVLVGPDHLRHHVEDRALLVHPRIHLLGMKSPHILPTYMRGLDVALMPYRINRWTQHIDPLKLYEYMAVGLPIVATPLPAVQDTASLMYVAERGEPFIEAVKEALNEGDNPGKRKERQRFAQENSWDVRVKQVREILKHHLETQK